MKQNYEIFLQWFKRLADLGGYYSRVGRVFIKMKLLNGTKWGSPLAQW